jgi:hypothetical protein
MANVWASWDAGPRKGSRRISPWGSGHDHERRGVAPELLRPAASWRRRGLLFGHRCHDYLLFEVSGQRGNGHWSSHGHYDPMTARKSPSDAGTSGQRCRRVGHFRARLDIERAPSSRVWCSVLGLRHRDVGYPSLRLLFARDRLIDGRNIVSARRYDESPCTPKPQNGGPEQTGEA